MTNEKLIQILQRRISECENMIASIARKRSWRASEKAATCADYMEEKAACGELINRLRKGDL